MFNNLGWGEFAVIVVVGLFLFGPDKLPKIAADLGRAIRQFRDMANSAQRDIKSQLGPEFADLDLRQLQPREFIRRQLELDDDDEQPGPSPAVAPAQRAPSLSKAPPAATGPVSFDADTT